MFIAANQCKRILIEQTEGKKKLFQCEVQWQKYHKYDNVYGHV